MSNHEFQVIARLRLDALTRDEAKAMQKVTKLNTEIAKTERLLSKTTTKTFYAIASTVTTLRSVLSAFGIALPAVFDAVLSAVNTTIYALQAIATAYMAGGVTALATAIVEGAAIGLSIVGIAAAIRGQQDAKTAMDQAESAARNIGLTLGAWSRMLGAG